MVRGALIFGRLVRVRHCLLMMYNNVDVFVFHRQFTLLLNMDKLLS